MARAGEGLGVEPFRPNRGPLKLSPNMIIENLAKVLDISADTVDSIADFEDAAAAGEPEQAAAAGAGLRVWTVEEAAAAAGSQHGLFWWQGEASPSQTLLH